MLTSYMIAFFWEGETKHALLFCRFKSAKKTDQRVRIMNEVITGIRVIKMYAWEYAFKRVVKALRK